MVALADGIATLIKALVPIFPWIAAWFVLDTSQGKQILTNATNAERAILQAPVSVAIKGWAVVAGIGAGLGLLIWLTESEIGKRQGYNVAPPPVESIHVPAGPSFGASGSVGVRQGPLDVSTGITSGGGGGGSVASGSVTRIERRAAASAPAEHRGFSRHRRAA